MPTNVVIGTIGGQKCTLKLLQMTKDIKDTPVEIDKKVFNTKDVQSVQELLEKYLADFKDKYPEYGTLAIAAPVKDNKVQSLTNFPHWKLFDGDEIAKNLKLKKLVFLNDFVANGYGVQGNLVKDKDYIVLNDKPKTENGPILVIGPGTGLGETFLTKSANDKYYQIQASEGSHSDFPARTLRQYKLKEFMQKYLETNYIPVEQCCCGNAIIGIYKFLYEYENVAKKDEEIAKIANEFKTLKECKQSDKLFKPIIEKGLSGECELCKKTLEMFIEILAVEVGNKAIFTLPSGGIYVLGTISLMLMPLITKTDIFMKNYLEKENENFKGIVENFPIYQVKNEDLQMEGVIECVRRILEN